MATLVKIDLRCAVSRAEEGSPHVFAASLHGEFFWQFISLTQQALSKCLGPRSHWIENQKNLTASSGAGKAVRPVVESM